MSNTNQEKEFFLQDLSGRKITGTLTLDDLINYWDNETDDDDCSAADWGKTAEVGDEWRNHTTKITRIK